MSSITTLPPEHAINPRKPFSLLLQVSQAGDVQAIRQAAKMLDEGRPPTLLQDPVRGLLLWEVAALYGDANAKSIFMKRLPNQV